MSTQTSILPQMLRRNEQELLKDWLEALSTAGLRRADSDRALDRLCREFLNLLQESAQSGVLDDVHAETWRPVREFLADFSRQRAREGSTSAETAKFIFSLKRPIFDRLRIDLAGDAEGFAEESWLVTELLDSLGLLTTETYQQTREDIISRQQQEMLELSTPVVKLWDGVLALPMIGTLDSARTQVVMETLLQRIVDTGASIAIIDITGVPTVDTLVAQHLLKTVTAARLMGADCIISGIRPQIAQTIVHLGLQLDVVTKATLADALAMALHRTGNIVSQRPV